MNVSQEKTVVKDEVARLYPVNVSSDFEDSLRSEIIDWTLSVPVGILPKDMKDTIQQFWNERLN